MKWPSFKKGKDKEPKRAPKIEQKKPYTDKEALQILFKEWPELIKLCTNKKIFDIEINDSDFYKLVLNKLNLPIVHHWEDDEIQFNIEFNISKLNSLMMILLASRLAPVLFTDPNVTLTWSNRDHRVRYTYDEEEVTNLSDLPDDQSTETIIKKPLFELTTKVDIKKRKIFVTLDWANIKKLLPYLKENLHILIFISKLGKHKD